MRLDLISLFRDMEEKGRKAGKQENSGRCASLWFALLEKEKKNKLHTKSIRLQRLLFQSSLAVPAVVAPERPVWIVSYLEVSTFLAQMSWKTGYYWRYYYCWLCCYGAAGVDTAAGRQSTVSSVV